MIALILDWAVLFPEAFALDSQHHISFAVLSIAATVLGETSLVQLDRRVS